MDQKKRRNSILKKPPTTDEENTAEIKIKRRISFSGKKSVKEFLAGEEQATIWGTSYEESAELLHASSVESAVVSVNDKRIVLRNRRVVVDSKRSTNTKRRSKKKVQVAENDKENVFVQTPQVETQTVSDSVPLEASVKENSSVQTDQTLARSSCQSVATVTVDTRNACSTTFDFINNSGPINKSVTIEQSVDVSLDDNELQMFKFRVPVKAIDASPNLTMARDGASPNIFCSSILMSDEDMRLIKLTKAQMGGLISKAEPLKMIESSQKLAITQGGDGDLIESSKADRGEGDFHVTSSAEMELEGEDHENDGGKAGKALEMKSLKRKTIAQTVNMDETTPWSDKCQSTLRDGVVMDLQSPMRKKPMHKQTDKTMNISTMVTEGEMEPQQRQTIFFQSVIVDQTSNDGVLCEESVCVQKTIYFDANQIHEDTVCQVSDVPGDEHVPMELSLVGSEMGEKLQQDVKKRQTVHAPVDAEESPKKCGSAKANSKRASVYNPVDMVEDSPKERKSCKSRRGSVYIHTDIVEDSPRRGKENDVQNPRPKDNRTVHQKDIQEISMQSKQSMSGAGLDGTKSRGAMRRTNVAGVDMVFEEDRQAKQDKDVRASNKGSKGSVQERKSIYVPSDMVEDSPQSKRTDEKLTKMAHRAVFREQKSICAPSDMMEETMSSADLEKLASEGAKIMRQDRKSIYTPSDIVEDSPESEEVGENHRVPGDAGLRKLVGERKSIYTRTDMALDVTNVEGKRETNRKLLQEVPRNRQSILTPSDIVEDSPESEEAGNERGAGTRSLVGERKSIHTRMDISKVATTKETDQNRLQKVIQKREFIYTPSDIVEDSPERQKTREKYQLPRDTTSGKLANDRKSIYIPTEMVLDLPTSEVNRLSSRDVSQNRKTICMASDILEDSHVGFPKKINETNRIPVHKVFQDRKSIYTSSDIEEDSPKTQKTRQTQLPPDFSRLQRLQNDRKSIYAVAEMVVDLPKARGLNQQSSKGVGQDRRSVYTATDMIEDSPKSMKAVEIQRCLDDRTPSESVQSRKSVYQPSDMIEDSPKPARPSEAIRGSIQGASKDRKSVYIAADIVEDSFCLLEAGKTPSSKRQSIHTPVDIMEDSPKAQRHVLQRQMSMCRDDKAEQKHRQTICAPADILEDSPPKERMAKVQATRMSQNVDIAGSLTVKSSLSIRTPHEQEPSLPRATNRQTICFPSDILEDSPPKLATAKNSHSNQSANHPTSSVSTCKTTTQQKNLEPKASTRQTICAPTDIVEDFPRPTARPSIYASVDIVEDSPKASFPINRQPVASAPKVTIKHVTLEKGILGDTAALKVLKTQQAKAKIAEPIPALDESTMEMSLVESAPIPTSPVPSARTNFSKLNEQLLRGEVKLFAEERKNQRSLFDRIETIQAERSQFEGFQNEQAEMPGYLMQPKKPLFDDYTLELSRNTFPGQVTKGNEYTMELSTRMHSRVEEINHNSNTESANDSMNVSVRVEAKESQPANDSVNLSVQMSPISTGVRVEAEAKPRGSNRQTIYFQKENEMDVSTTGPLKAAALRRANRQTIHFQEHFETDNTSTQTFSKASMEQGFERNPRTIHFDENIQMEETKLVTFVKVENLAHDASTMEVSMQDDCVTFEATTAETMSSKLGNSENFTRQSCIVRTPLLDAAPMPSASHRQTICAPADILEVTRDQNQVQQKENMDLSTSICPEAPESSQIQGSHRESTSSGRQRRTIHCYDDLELEDTVAESASTSHQETRRFDLVENVSKSSAPQVAVERKKASAIPTRIAGRKTIHFNQDLEIDEEKTKKLSHNLISTSESKTTYFQDDVGMEVSLVGPPVENKPNEFQRRGIGEEEAYKFSHNLKAKSDRKTKYFQEDASSRRPDACMEVSLVEPSVGSQSNQRGMLNEEKSNKSAHNLKPTSNRQTIFFEEHIGMDDTHVEPSVETKSNEFERQGIGHEKATKSSANLKSTSDRKTIHFQGDACSEHPDNGMEVSHMEPPAETKRPQFQRQELVEKKTKESLLNRRKTVYFQEDVGMDVSLAEPPVETQPTGFPCKEDASKPLPKPRRMTTFEDLPVEIDEATEKITLRKSSFSRTLNFDEIARATGRSQTEKDSPLLRCQPRLNRAESTTDINRSLAEYLKMEAAATLYRCSPENTAKDCVEQSPQSVYYDAEDEQIEREHFVVAHQNQNRMHALEESGMQPLQKSASRRDIEEDVLDEPAEKEEPDQEPDQGPDQEPLEMSFELRTVQANRLNHEFFDSEISTSPKRQQAKLRRQTILEPEPMMMEGSDTESTSPKEPVKISVVHPQPSRKTIHFTNENAVDESFFDEKFSKPAVAPKIQITRQTVFFNESQNSIEDVDTSLPQAIPKTQVQPQSIGKSKAAQSMMEILSESNKLFTQSLLKPYFFETKPLTVDFDARDTGAHVVENLKQEENVECTPTKANKSRIPQLIGSAKKLQSMKESMEFIQQKLPKLGSSIQPKGEEASSPDVEESVEVSPEEVSLTCPPKKLQESFETIEIPRKLVTSSAKNTEESFIEIPRRATTFQRNDTLYLCQNEVDITNISQKSNYRFEDVPITISDVSTYFSQNPPPTAAQTNEKSYSPNTTEALCNLDMNKFADETQVPKSSDSEDTTCNFKKFKKRYVELTCESLHCSGEDIEKTHLSLVNTLDEGESEVVRESCSEAFLPPGKFALCVPPSSELQSKEPPSKEPTSVESPSKESPSDEPPAKKSLSKEHLPLSAETFSSSVCRKCKGHKQAASQNDTTISSFVLPSLPVYQMNLDALKELRGKPRILNVAKMWQQNLRESDSFNFSAGTSALDLEDDDTLENFIASLDKERRTAAQQRTRKEFKNETSFVHALQKKMQSTKTNWCLNDLLLTANVLKFSHARIRTFAIQIRFTPKDSRGVDVDFKEVRIVPNVHYTRSWTAFDYALHYQMLVELPFDLRTLCPKSENLFDLLDHVENVTRDVLETGKAMLYLVLSSPATLIREPSGGVYIRKYARTRTPQDEVQRTEFHIEVRNMKRLGYDCITQPPLYEFDEKIKLLPTGQDFLRVFLADPMRYMKS